MSCATCTGTCQSAAIHGALSQLTKLTAELVKAVADIRVDQIDDRERLNAHGLLLESHHKILNNLCREFTHQLPEKTDESA